MAWMRQVVERLASLGDSPQRTAAAFALGVFLSFSPFLGLQIALGMTAAVAFRLHKIAVFIGLCTNLPWFMIPWYVLTTTAAASALGLSLASDMSDRLSAVFSIPIYRAAFWQRSIELLGPYLWSFVIGPTTGAAVLGMLAYVFVLRVITSVRISTPAP